MLVRRGGEKRSKDPSSYPAVVFPKESDVLFQKKKEKKKFKNPQKTPTNIWPYSTYLINVLTISTFECPNNECPNKA